MIIKWFHTEKKGISATLLQTPVMTKPTPNLQLYSHKAATNPAATNPNNPTSCLLPIAAPVPAAGVDELADVTPAPAPDELVPVNVTLAAVPPVLVILIPLIVVFVSVSTVPLTSVVLLLAPVVVDFAVAAHVAVVGRSVTSWPAQMACAN